MLNFKKWEFHEFRGGIKVSQCLNCQYNGEEFDGEAIPRYDGGGQWVGICAKGYSYT